VLNRRADDGSLTLADREVLSATGRTIVGRQPRARL